MVVPEAASDEELLRVHDREYLERVKAGTLSENEVRRIGFPWSPQMVERSRRSVGGTIAACRSASNDGVAVNLAGGTHHAFADRGEGFCVFNDAAVAARAVQAEGHAERVLIIDCDVHQGNGTAAIFAEDPTVFTFSIHGANNFPFRKVESDLDVPLPDGVVGDVYQNALDEALDRLTKLGGIDLAIYLAGADPYINDRYGKLALSLDDLSKRDRTVIEWCRDMGMDVATVMSGGYARNIDEIVDIHFSTVRTTARFDTRTP